MEESTSDFWKDTFPDFEHLHFGDDTETAHSDNIPERETVMKDNNNHREDHVSWTESDIDTVKTESFMNNDMEVKNRTCSRNDGLFDEQRMKTRSVLYGSLDDYDLDEEKTQAEDQQLRLHEEKHKEDQFEMHKDISQMIKQQAHTQVEDVSFIEKVPPEETQRKVKYQMVMEEKTSQLPEDKSSSSSEEEDRTDLDRTEEHNFQHTPDNNESSYLTKFQDCTMMSTDVQPRCDIKEFTEDDHVRVEEGLADYPSDLSQSENEDSSEGHEDETSTHMNTKLDEEHSFHQTENLAGTSMGDDSKSKDRFVNPADTITYIKNDNVDVFKNYQFLNNSYGDKDNNGIKNTGISVDTKTVENFQSVASTVGSSEDYMNEQPEYDSDISSDDDDDDDDDDDRSQEEEHDPIVHTHKKKANIASHEQENMFTKDISKDWNSIECGEADMKDQDICDAGGLSDNPAFPEDGMAGSAMDDYSAYGTHSTENSSSSVSQLQSFNLVKPDQNNKEHENEPLEVSYIGENLNSLLPETFWNSIDDDNLKLDEYEWDINAEEEICDEDNNFLEELENEVEIEMGERDWEIDQERIQAFERYYKLFEGDEYAARSHKVTFSLDTELTQYEEEYSSGEEELSTNSCVNELHPAELNSDNLHQSNEEHNSEPSEVLCAGENVHNVQPETLWSSALLMDDDNMKLNEYDHDIQGEDFNNEKEHFLEGQINDGQEMKRDLEQDVFNRYHEEFVGGEENRETVTDRSHDVMFNLDQESSQNEDNESSEQESNTEEDTFNIKTEEQSESDEPQERRLYKGRQKVLLKGLQKPDRKLKEPKSKCLVLLRSVLAASLVTMVGVVSYWWATDDLDWIY